MNPILAALTASLLLTAGSASAWSVDPNPPQITVDYFFAPRPLIQFHSSRLVYEMRLTNYTPNPYNIEAIDAAAGAKVFSYSGVRLKNMMKVVGVPGFVGTDTTIASGATLEVFFTLGFDNPSEIPSQIGHTLHVAYTDGSHHTLQAPGLAVDSRPPVVVAPPLRGTNWIAGDASHNGTPFEDVDGPIDAAHRRATLVSGGHAYLAQRYAIDWVKYKIINGRGETFSGPVSSNSSYFCYGEDIHSVAAGRVIEVLDGLADNIPQKAAVIPINFVTAGGNHVIVDIGNGRYAFYAHIKPGSIPSNIRVGASVKRGQILGHVGNSGSSSEPHLHFHITDGPSFLAANGVPYEMTKFAASRSATVTERPDGTVYFTNIGALQAFQGDYPEANAPVAF